MTGLARIGLRGVGVATLVVLAGFGCSLIFSEADPEPDPPPPPPTANERFEGCYDGLVIVATDTWEMTLVLEKVPETAFELTGCLSLVLPPENEKKVLTVLAGRVRGDNELLADLDGPLVDLGIQDVLLTRTEQGEALTVEETTGAFEPANLLRCASESTFAELCPVALYPPSLQGGAP